MTPMSVGAPVPSRRRATPRGMCRGTRWARSERGDTLAFVIVWPTLMVAVLVMSVQVFIAVNAQSEAEVAASHGLRAAWRAAARADLYRTEVGSGHPFASVTRAVHDGALAGLNPSGEAWRWWTPQAIRVYSDFCAPDVRDRPALAGGPGWVRVTVRGEAFGPLAAFGLTRFIGVNAVAEGPIIGGTSLTGTGDGSGIAPADLPECLT